MRKEEMLSVVLLHLFFLLFCVGKARTSHCSSTCGEIGNINYPFRLKGDNSSCGDQRYELSCDNYNNTILYINQGRYQVKRISYENQTIRLVSMNSISGNCSLPYPSPDISDWFVTRPYELVNYDDVAMFMNCSKSINHTTFRRIPCLSGTRSNIYVLYRGTITDLQISCSIVSVIPLHLDELLNTTSVTADIQALLQTGFEIYWHPTWESTLGPTWDPNPTWFQRFQTWYPTWCPTWDPTWCPTWCPIWDVSEKFCSLFTRPEAFYWCTNVSFKTEWIGMYYLELKIIQKFILTMIIFAFVIYSFLKNRKTFDSIEKFLCNHQTLVPKRYTYTDIIGMTNHFREKLGQGGFGSVYKGQIPGCLMAIKMLGNSKCNGEDFINEVATIGRIHHVNVVKLIGFCSEGSKRALVYEYMPNGSLEKYIFSKKPRHHLLNWKQLHDIALGIAKGIEYLHRGCDMCILHFDIKPQNILLDHTFTPKVSDFGLSKLYPREYDFVSVSTTRGTIGYIAPELISRNFGVVSDKSDVYSFGMLLLEMAGGRKNVDVRMDNLSEIYFPSWVYDQLDQGKELAIENATEIELKVARKLCIVGLWCIQMKPVDRPSMTKVIEMLEENVDNLQMPPKPVLSSPRQISMRDSHTDSSSTELVTIELE